MEELLNVVKKVVIKIKKIIINNKLIVGLILLNIIIFVSVIIIFIYFENEIKDVSNKETITNDVADTDLIYVEIKGQVAKPGIYNMNSNDRVIDVITKAGGLTSEADTKANNLSAKINDEMVITIYSKEEIKNYEEVKKLENEIYNNCNSNIYATNSCAKVATSESKNTPNNNTLSVVSINNGTKEQLMNLPGIGESKALKIIEYRNSNGSFKTIDDIKNVSGIGESLFAKIKEYITT